MQMDGSAMGTRAVVFALLQVFDDSLCHHRLAVWKQSLEFLTELLIMLPPPQKVTPISSISLSYSYSLVTSRCLCGTTWVCVQERLFVALFCADVSGSSIAEVSIINRCILMLSARDSVLIKCCLCNRIRQTVRLHRCRRWYASR